MADTVDEGWTSCGQPPPLHHPASPAEPSGSTVQELAAPCCLFTSGLLQEEIVIYDELRVAKSVLDSRFYTAPLCLSSLLRSTLQEWTPSPLLSKPAPADP